MLGFREMESEQSGEREKAAVGGWDRSTLLLDRRILLLPSPPPTPGDEQQVLSSLLRPRSHEEDG